MAKTFLATQEQVDTIATQITSINGKITPIDLSSVYFGVMDFLYDELVIISGGLESIERRITT